MIYRCIKTAPIAYFKKLDPRVEGIIRVVSAVVKSIIIISTVEKRIISNFEGNLKGIPLRNDECELPMRRITKSRNATAYSEYLLGLQRSI
jgi:hypothetical protein